MQEKHSGYNRGVGHAQLHYLCPATYSLCRLFRLQEIGTIDSQQICEENDGRNADSRWERDRVCLGKIGRHLECCDGGNTNKRSVAKRIKMQVE